MRIKWISALAGLPLLLVLMACTTTPAPATLPSVTSMPESPLATPQIPPTTPPDSPATGVPPATAVPPSPTPQEALAALVNGQPITIADYERELERYRASLTAQGIDPNSPDGQEELAQARGWILDMMIEQMLTAQVADQAGIQITDAQVEEYMQTIAAESGGEEALRAQLEAWGETYEDAKREVRMQLIGMAMAERIVADVAETAEHVHARHILVDTAEEANRLRAELEAGADFAALAKAHSLDQSTRENGGDLGYFPRGILVSAEVEDAAFSLQPGQFSDVVSSALGYHIVQVVERDPNRSVSPENLQLLRERAVQQWVEDLWARADVQRFVETTP
jgi:peptidyl-prolyl cis-trans isomerase C